MILVSAMKVRRWTNRREFGGRQELVREYRVMGLKVWSSVVDTESVPAWAEIQKATLGYTEWKSKFAAHIV